jgi:hypothetical protein
MSFAILETFGLVEERVARQEVLGSRNWISLPIDRLPMVDTAGRRVQRNSINIKH